MRNKPGSLKCSSSFSFSIYFSTSIMQPYFLLPYSNLSFFFCMILYYFVLRVEYNEIMEDTFVEVFILSPLLFYAFLQCLPFFPVFRSPYRLSYIFNTRCLRFRCCFPSNWLHIHQLDSRWPSTVTWIAGHCYYGTILDSIHWRFSSVVSACSSAFWILFPHLLSIYVNQLLRMPEVLWKTVGVVKY